MKIIIVVVVIVLVVIAGIAVAAKIIINNRGNIMDGGNMTKYSDELLDLVTRDKKYDKLVSINYSNSGNSLGNVDHIKVDVINKKIIVEYKAEHSDPLLVKEYSYLETELQVLLDLIEEYNYPMWSDLKVNQDMIALDASHTVLSFEYDNSAIGGSKMTWYNLYYEMEMPDDAYEALRELDNQIHALVKDRNLIRDYTKEEE